MELCDLLAAKCGRLASALKTGSQVDVTHLFGEIPTNSEAFELVARFCQGFELNFSAENVVPLSCLAHFLDMSESHCRNNLLRKALVYFEHKVLPSWNETVKAFRTTESVLGQARQIGILGACVESLVSKAISDPNLLGDPVRRAYIDEYESESAEDGFRPNARRRLFMLSWKSEDLTTLPLRLYEPLIREMIDRGVPSGHVAVSLSDYATKWAFSVFAEEDGVSVYRRNSQREIVESVERLLPDERGLVSCAFLFEMLRCANVLDASSDCKEMLELRIGKDLDEATVKDLLILSRGCRKEEQYDIECLRRILKHFYGNYTSTSISGLVKVAEMVEEFLVEIASDMDLDRKKFAELAEISADVSKGTQRSSDGIYKGVDVYLDNHKHLTESEREEVCQVLDIHKMSPEACDHAAKNERLPLRLVLQVLFVVQLNLRDLVVAREAHSSQDGAGFEDDEEDVEDEEESLLGRDGVVTEMKMMGEKLEVLERNCAAMKREIERDNAGQRRVMKREKVSFWKEMKRKFGCVSASVSDCHCQVKRKKRRN